MPRRPKPLDWKRLDSGWYVSEDGRWEIVRVSVPRDCRCPSQLCIHRADDAPRPLTVRWSLSFAEVNDVYREVSDHLTLLDARFDAAVRAVRRPAKV